MDYDKQEEEDLEKAKALSLETLALDQYRRNRFQYGMTDVSSSTNIYKSTSHNTLPASGSSASTTRPRPGSVGSSSTLPTSASNGSLAPPPRNASEGIPTRDEPDLISFSAPSEFSISSDLDDHTDSNRTSNNTSNSTTASGSHASFLQIIDDMHSKLNAQLQERASKYSGMSTSTLPGHSSTIPNIGYPHTQQINLSSMQMQLVPYGSINSIGSPSSFNAIYPNQLPMGSTLNLNKGQLTNDQLTKLYNMNTFGRGSPNSQYNQYGYQTATLPQSITNQHHTQIFNSQQHQSHTTTFSHQTSQFSQTVTSSSSGNTQQPLLDNKFISTNSTVYSQQMNIAHITQNQQQSQLQSQQIQERSLSIETASYSSSRNDELALVPKLPPRQPSIDSSTFIEPSSSHSSRSRRESSTSRRRTSTVKPSSSDDLIDLNNGIEDNSRVSVLEAFDPLLSDGNLDYDEKGDAASDCTTSYYSEYDPFDYLYSCGTQYSDPVYEAVNKLDRNPLSPANSQTSGWNLQQSASAASVRSATAQPPPPLPPRNSRNKLNQEQYSAQDQVESSALSSRKIATKLYENVIVNKCYDAELIAFYNMVKRIRSQYPYNDEKMNIGHVVASEFNYNYPGNTSIKLMVHPLLNTNTGTLKRTHGGETNGTLDASLRNSPGDRASTSSNESVSLNNQKGYVEGYGPPVVFTCDICTTVEHVIMHVFCELEGQFCFGSVEDYVVKPIGVNEWLKPSSKLNQLECVHTSIKLEQDVQLGLWPKIYANLNGMARTQQDDIRDANLKLEDIMAHEPVETINYDNLMILLETLEAEIEKLESSVMDARPHTVLSCSSVVQPVKMICALLGSIDMLEITDAVDELKMVCANGQAVYSYRESGAGMLDVVSENGDYAEVKLRPKTTYEQIKYRCNHIREAVQSFIETFTQAFRVDFCVNNAEYQTTPIPISSVSDMMMAHIMCLHRVSPHWKHDDYMLGAQIYHGTRYIGDAVVTQCSNEIGGGLFPRLKFDSWLNFDSIPICTLPRESRLIFVLYGCTAEPAEGADSNDTSQDRDRKVTKIELGWCSIQFFDFERNMIQGSYLLPLWPPTTDKFLGPAPAKGTHPHGAQCPILSIDIPSYGGKVIFPEPPKNNPVARCLDFNSLDCNLQQELIDTAEQGFSSAVDKREVLWEKRYYLQSLPHALPKILHAAHSWDFASVVDLHALIKSWKPLSPLQTLELFLPRYPDIEVRAQAVRWVSAMSNDQLVDYLPQLLQALKHDTYEASTMAEFLLERSLESLRVAHHLYWLLVHNLPGDSPQNTIEQYQNESDETVITQARYNRRNQIMLRALLAICGEKLSAKFLAQNMMCKSLTDTANSVKQAKESIRQKILVQGMETVNQILLERPTALPLGPGQEVTGVNSRTCSYFNSNTLPLKVNFMGPDRMLLPAIFKAGDDLQQDMLTIQLVRVMDRLWLEEGLDLKMVTFNCVPTGYKRGMIEMITDAETLRKIQVEWGLTGSFKDKPIAEWLQRQNPSQLEYERAVDNFTVSCAGYSVVTYILGICDRHNDNIMLKTSGHLFHIDFGKFLGDAQMFGNFKRDRTPFVLTSDMAYVINMGDRPSIKFQHFVDLCCKAFNIVRKHGDLILHMLALMATSGIPGVTADAVNYVRNALLPEQSSPEAAASFAKLIHISLKSWFTQFNFFLHNLAQMRFTGEEMSGELLSFVPRRYTMAQDGRLQSVTVHGYQKRYDLEKYYTYILKVTRQNQPDPAYLFRSFKEFCEFHQKLLLHFPLAKLHSLSSGIHVGRSNIKTVADRRLPEIKDFLKSLFNSADEIAHSDVVYTFFHPLLRDQQEQDISVAKVKEPKQIAMPSDRVCGEIKLSLQYHRGALTLMIHHARSLPATTGGQEPNTYVKAYLKPDPAKSTKRKTKVVRKNCFPSFMETLEYRMPLEHIQNRILQVTVWSHDSLQENEFLGGVELRLSELNLKEEFIKWFPLGYLSRS